MSILSSVAGEKRVKYSQLIWVLCKSNKDFSPLNVSTCSLFIDAPLHLPQMLSLKPFSGQGRKNKSRDGHAGAFLVDLGDPSQQGGEGGPGMRRAANPPWLPMLTPKGCVSFDRVPQPLCNSVFPLLNEEIGFD